MSFEKLKKSWLQKKEDNQDKAEKYKKLLMKRGMPVFKKFGIKKVVVFGSVMDGRFSGSSDLDIFVQDLTNKGYWRFRHEIEEAVGISIDLYTDQDDPIFVNKILTRGEVIYDI